MCSVYLRRIDRIEVAVENDEVGDLAGGDGPFHGFSKFGVGRAEGEGAKGFIQSDFLFGNPAIGMFSVQRLTSNGRFESFERVERGDSPVGAERQNSAGVQERTKGIGAFGSLCADAFFAP